MLAERKIDTSGYSRDKTPCKGTNLKPNEQNVKNRAREVTFQEHINRYVSGLCIKKTSFHHRRVVL